MTTKPNDPLLTVTQVLLRIVQGVILAVGIFVSLVIPVLWIRRSDVLAELAKEIGPNVPGTEALVAITVLMLGGLVVLAIGWAFVKRMCGIIGTVSSGTPFTPDNAKRLREMGWLVLATQGLALLALPVSAWVATRLPDGGDVNVRISFEAILMALLLFILARVFEHGTRLTEDVEGTV